MLNLEPKESWQVKLPVFEGPLDLLLYLIKRDELDVYDIPIEKITRDYVDYLKAMELLNLEIAGEYLVIAATLLYIKSRLLLPVDQQPPEDEIEQEDPRWELVRQLVEYKKFKDAALHLGEQGALREGMFPRDPKDLNLSHSPRKQAPQEANVFDLLTALQRVLDQVAQREKTQQIQEEKFTVAEKMAIISELLQKETKVFFHDLFQNVASQVEVVVTFLALLELARLKQLQLQQDDAFGEIAVIRMML